MTHPAPQDSQRWQAIKAKLLQRQEELEREISAARAEIEQDAQNSPEEPGDAAQRLEAKEVRQAELARDQAEHASIGRALARIDAGEYGQCAQCGQSISEQRLLARPESTLCINCKQEAEEHAH
ncbi:hypothetical protein CLI92_08350 [Vandammella animalimorsus]|uniref:Zinc finger DksA/TraR C4-type domain-containing protein n=1 Tax=Vandammella animalimorsus TaxID=2029117 RepID=A0A2A2T4L2_9BURK|nr:TraR/DksA family transcriptional regulator [Vandammella animalimorsus]RRD66753.1 TraR/DksA family transcriptional regulator [Comamonadaceae bacterium OH2310_COT-174]PAT31367.1 hypothetical protein CK626_10205 [Vandammella animalimorsus]PAT34549.1 hypothetical protein CK620_06470 [Vandammella animalimorsus]PAX16358.1 hypothetical protein CLI92_08350 [Vandammella animalimorsus]PAX18773.1 hypothetical protein CLI93_10430 [Vandammella animalimorsus]